MEFRESLHSLLTIWVKPRQTIRNLLDKGNARFVILLAIIGGIATSLDRASTKSMGETMDVSTIVVISLIGGTIGGIITLMIGSALIKWTGRWIGGKGTFDDVKTAFAWSNVTAIVSLLLWIPLGLLYGREMFTDELTAISSSMVMMVLFFVFMAIEIILFIWTIVILVKSVAEAQQFSAWKGLLNLVLTTLVIIVPIILLGILIFVTT